MKNEYENWSKEDLLNEIKKLKRRKRYGLVWEDKLEDVVEKCKTQLPVLEEVISKSILNKSHDAYNILIEGDNYHSLSVLNYTHRKSVDLIYIDPPYNTGNHDFLYNDTYVDKEDTYRHSKWLAFMDIRLRLAKNLLKKNGSLFISIDDNEYPRLVMLVEEIFGETNVKTICIKMSEATGVKMASVLKSGRIPKLKEYLVIVKQNGIRNLHIDKTPKEKWDNEYKNIIVNTTEDKINAVKEIRDSENRSLNDLNQLIEIVKHWKTMPLSTFFDKNNISKKEQKEFKYANAWRIFRTVATTKGAKSIADKMRGKLDQDVELFPIITPQKKLYLMLNNYNIEQEQPRIKILLADDYLTQHPGDFWTDIKTTGLGNEGGVNFRNGKKPLALIDRIIKTNQNNNITILDFFAGSGTTAESIIRLNKADSGNRKFILCTYNEEHNAIKIIDDYCYPRIINTIRDTNSKSNLKYYKTAFMDSAKTDANKALLTRNAIEMLCIKEDTYTPVSDTANIKIFENHEKFLAVLLNTEAIAKLKKQIRGLNKPISVYIFSLSNDLYEDAFVEFGDQVTLSPIPEAIYKVYKRIFQ